MSIKLLRRRFSRDSFKISRFPYFQDIVLSPTNRVLSARMRRPKNLEAGDRGFGFRSNPLSLGWEGCDRLAFAQVNRPCFHRHVVDRYKTVLFSDH